MRALESACELAEAQQVPPLRYAPVGMTNFLQETASKAVGWRVVNGPTQLSSRPERSVGEGPAVPLPVLTQPPQAQLNPLRCSGSVRIRLPVAAKTAFPT